MTVATGADLRTSGYGRPDCGDLDRVPGLGQRRSFRLGGAALTSAVY